MDRDRLRVVVPAILSVVLIGAATMGFEWFVFAIDGAELTSITFDLREARACDAAGVCGTAPTSMIKGSFYPTLAEITFWSSLVFAALVLYQTGARAVRGAAIEPVTKAAHCLGTLVVLTSVGAGYLFGPDLEPVRLMGFGIDIDRGWGPISMLFGLMAGHVALYNTRDSTRDEVPLVALEPVIPRTVTTTRVPLPLDTPPRGQPTASTRSHEPTTPPPMRAIPDHLKGKIRFSMVTGEVTGAGIDARREDGESVLVMWRDVVGLVVRRLPPELGDHPFIDIVSTVGMTLRVLPWSKLSGELFEGDATARVRAFLKSVRARCPGTKLDRATQAFLDDETKPPAQLTNLALLAKHDEALA